MIYLILEHKILYLDYIEKSYDKKVFILKKDPMLRRFDKIELSVLSYVKKVTCKYTTYINESYPQKFHKILRAPLVIYYYGDIHYLNEKLTAITGSTNNTFYGDLFLKKFLKDKANKSIITGTSFGIDNIVYKYSKEYMLNSIALFGGGLSKINKKRYYYLYSKLIFSEYPPSKEVSKETILEANRLITSLCQNLFIIESAIHDKSMLIVGEALDQQKEIYALPGSVFSKKSTGTNLLIEEGANILTLNTKI